MAPESVEVMIGGQKMHIRAENPADLQEHVELVNRTLAEITGSSGEINVRVALLAALNLAETLTSERKKNLQLLREIRDRAVRILECMDRILW